VHVWRQYERWNRWDVLEFLVTHGFQTDQGGPERLFAGYWECLFYVEAALRKYETEIYLPTRDIHAGSGDFRDARDPRAEAVRRAETQVPWKR
jgi:hypothetical protein